jgi:predicted nucleic acid-binding protein
MSFLLDTNVISELIARRPDANVIRWVESQDPETIFLSVITVGELNRGIQRLADSRRKKVLSNWLTGDLLVRFGDRILPLDTPVMMTWGALVARMEHSGQLIRAIDSLLAATAAQHGLAMATRNVRDFKATGISITNPWELPS